MIEGPLICLNVLQHLQDWESRESFAFSCRSVYDTCLSETLHVPQLTINLCSPKPIATFQSLTVRSLTLTTVADNSSIVSINQIISLLETMSRLQQLTITKPFNHRGIRKLIAYLKPNHYGLELFVPACNFVQFYRRLTVKHSPTLDHKITLLPIDTLRDSSSSSDEEQDGLTKKDYDAYEVPYEVEKAMVGVRKALMTQYITSGRAMLKRRRVSNPFYLDLLIKQNIVNKCSTYQLLSDKNSPPLDLSCLLTKPIDIASIDNIIIPAGIKFIESIVCFRDNWLFITQVDAFVRNDLDIDPCAMDTKLINYPETPVARIIQKSYKRRTWHEVMFLYGRFEFLVTGGIYGNIHDSGLKSFLGASFKIKTPADEDSTTSSTLFSQIIRAPSGNKSVQFKNKN
ncbi:uncharacterized protein BX663DRAFT_554248 [Cokeromyces recurvatus]|uniref:uncharacterized protein n=1 Tax=Cokeromyces recurvatus TaxID=90255 RepID=UPI0022210937|nr:uncharacterized protein BX663DRAFT_554248 [Cokeromyces recurvatus]KAI7900363.1 hypothetical protein BX663DRAFT_554248 [Cokeromyces recurvatus]